MESLHRPAPPSQQLLSFLSVVLCCLFFVAVNIYWLLYYRVGFNLDIDEAGYTSYAVNLAHAFQGGGLGNWLNVFTYPNPQAPFTMAVASFLMVISGQTQAAALLTNSMIGFFLLMAVYLLGSRVYDRSIGIIATILVASNPYIVDYSRQFQFAAAASLFFIAAIYCYWRSDGLKNFGWVAALGTCAALMVLSRTMTLAFIPAMGIVFLADSVKRGTTWKTIGLAVAAALMVFMLISGPWFVVNAKGVFGYLFSFGYGQHAAEYGSASGVFTLGNISARLYLLVSHLMLLHAVILGVGGILLLSFMFTGRTKENDRYSFAGLAMTLATLCYLILLSSKNEGSSFEMPLVPLLTVAITGGIGQSVSTKAIRRILAGMTIMICGLGFVPLVDRNACEAGNKWLSSSHMFVPLVSYCGGEIQLYIDTWGARNRIGPKLRYEKAISAEKAKAWNDVSKDLAKVLVSKKSAKQGVAFAARHILVNVNTVNLDLVETTGAFLPVAQIEPGVLPRTVDGYKIWLTSPEVARGCYVIALNSNDGEFEPSADPAMLRQALDDLNYGRVEEVGTPTPGQLFQVFQNPVSRCVGQEKP